MLYFPLSLTPKVVYYIYSCASCSFHFKIYHGNDAVSACRKLQWVFFYTSSNVLVLCPIIPATSASMISVSSIQHDGPALLRLPVSTMVWKRHDSRAHLICFPFLGVTCLVPITQCPKTVDSYTVFRFLVVYGGSSSPSPGNSAREQAQEEILHIQQILLNQMRVPSSKRALFWIYPECWGKYF